MDESFFQPVEKERAKQMNPVVLAFVGDAFYTLYVRRSLALKSSSKTGELNKRATEKVSAHGQSALTGRVLERLSEEETEIYHRGRNAKKPTKSKNASPVEYARSTGIEAVMGYLYLTGQRERLKELLQEEDNV